VVIDEIGTEAETHAARTISQRGVQLFATAHGSELENVIKNPSLVDLVGGVGSVTLGARHSKYLFLCPPIRLSPPILFSCLPAFPFQFLSLFFKFQGSLNAPCMMNPCMVHTGDAEHLWHFLCACS
jgi:hypothetical protein